MTITHTWPIRVYYEDTDAGGIVYYANYLKFFERARTEWLRALGFEQDIFLEQNLAFVVKQVQMDYQMPARFNQRLSVKSQIVELKKASLVFNQQVHNENNNCLVSAQIRVACVDLTSMRPKPIPSDMLGEFSSVV